MTKSEAKDRIKRIIKSNEVVSYGGQYDSEKIVSINTRTLKQDLFDFIELHWNERSVGENNWKAYP